MLRPGGRVRRKKVVAVPVGRLPIGTRFKCPWSPEPQRTGRLETIGGGAALVALDAHLGDPATRVTWSLETMVEPIQVAA